MSFAFQYLDLAVVLIILASAGYATYRGLVAESLAVFGWIAAAYATLFFGPWVSWWMQGMLQPHWLGQVAGYALVFIIVLVPLHFAASRISQNVKKSQIGTLDSVLGTGFGILRGIAIIGIAYLVFTAWVPLRQQPGWVVNSGLFPAIRASAEVVASLIPDQSIRAPSEDAAEEAAAEEAAAADDPIVQKMRESQGDTASREPPPPQNTAPAQKPRQKAAKPAKKTYGAKDRQALDRLIETTNSDESGKR